MQIPVVRHGDVPTILTMHPMNISRVDLNLLPSLIALLDERQISRAASRVGMSQSAMSRALQRLRRVLDDELLVRTENEYRLTPRAHRIRAQLAAVVPQLDAMFADDAFEPEREALDVQLAGSDYVATVLAPALYRRIRTASPTSTVRFRHWHRGVFDEIDSGELDLVFFGGPDPPGLKVSRLFTERFVCVVDRNHPLAGENCIELDAYLGCQHVSIDIDTGQQPAVDLTLAALGVAREAPLTLPFHAAALRAVPNTNLVVTIPSLLVDSQVDHAATRVLRAPREIETLNYLMAWHPVVDNDARHVWLRETVAIGALELQRRVTTAPWAT
jgi:DNA-binding transcriptional LysR family regulator